MNTNKTHFTVGIGASAGGLESLVEFFQHIPAKLNIAFIVVTHLHRDHKSILDKLLKTDAKLPVSRVEKDIKIEPGNIYVLIENSQLQIEDSELKVKTRDKKILNFSIDIFFESLAADFADKAVGIILSGGGNDGLEGAQAISKAGGLILVQDPLSAKADGMPNSIIGHDHPSAVLRPGELAEKLVEWCQPAPIEKRP
jgi:two-component system chemotaxis response regulator CheB